MAAVLIVLLKTLALSDLTSHRGLALILVAAWGRWGQLVAIARYPYLRPEGKGALHKTAIHSLWEAVPTLLLLGAIGGLAFAQSGERWLGVYLTTLGATIAILTGAWFNHKLGGHTGDTYGATVEWTETLLLVGLTLVL
jgi:adenosylcobinamide-GDP ribazoletransferase